MMLKLHGEARWLKPEGPIEIEIHRETSRRGLPCLAVRLSYVEGGHMRGPFYLSCIEFGEFGYDVVYRVFNKVLRKLFAELMRPSGPCFDFETKVLRYLKASASNKGE